jgi:hypothetical protein
MYIRQNFASIQGDQMSFWKSRPKCSLARFCQNYIIVENIMIIYLNVSNFSRQFLIVYFDRPIPIDAMLPRPLNFPWIHIYTIYTAALPIMCK